MTSSKATNWPQNAPPLLVVLSGPSGAGKDTILQHLRKLQQSLHFVVTTTTRPRRESEVNGIDYIFLSRTRFMKMVDQDEFLEYADVYGHLYGSPRQQIRDGFSMGKDVILKLDIQGAEAVKRLMPDTLLIFLAPGSEGELRTRLQQRNSERGPHLERRIQAAQIEMGHLQQFDYCVVNREGHIEEAVDCIDAIIRAERCRIPPRLVTVQS